MPTRALLPFSAVPATLRMLCLAALMSCSLAHADDYTDVSTLIGANQYPEALAKADQYLATKPRDPQMRFLKGLIQTETGKTADAITTFTKITEDYPELPEPYNNLAVLYATQSQFDKARVALEMAIRTNPSYATAHENLGDIYARLASQAYSKALQLDGNNTAVQPKLALVRTLFSADNKPGAKPAPAAPASPAAAVKTPATSTPTPAAPVVAATKATPPTPPAHAAPTPAAPAPKVAAPTAGAEKAVEAAVHSWAKAWSDRNMAAYLASYGDSFDTPGKQSRKAWEEDRRARIVGKSRIEVKLSNLSVAVQGDKATAKFKQDYSADALNVSSRKTLSLVKSGEHWVIVKESTGS